MMMKLLSRHICFLILMVVIVGCGEAPDRPRDGYFQVANSPAMVVAKVGDKAITRHELAKAVNASAQPLLVRGGKLPENFEETMLELMIRSEIFYQAGKNEVSGADDRAEQLYIRNLERYPSESALAEDVARDGLTMEEFKEKLHKQAVVEIFLDERIHSKLKFSDREIKEYYQNYQESFREPNGEVKPLDDVRQKIIISLSAPLTPKMVEALYQQLQKEIPVQRFYPPPTPTEN